MSRSMMSRSTGTVRCRPTHRCSTGRPNGAPPPSGEDLPLFRPFMLAHPARTRPWSTWRTMRRSGSGTGSASRSSTSRMKRAAKRGSIRVQAMTFQARFPEIAERADDRRPCSTANCSCAVRHQGGPDNERTQGGAASFNALQQRLGRKAVSEARCWPSFRRSCGSTTS